VQCLAANEISDIVGILNGTTNFILTKMVKEGMPFDEALAMAQRLGYAEKDPSADIDGVDACRKIAILTSLAFGKHVDPDLVYTEGIAGITLTDVAYAEKWGGVIKLIGRVRRFDDDRVMPTVYPAFIPGYSQLSTVDDVFNAIMVRGDAIGDVMFYGRGAGKLPTASAVVADVVDCVKHIKARKYLFWEESEPGYIRDHATAFGEMFVRAATSDYEGALAFLSDAFKIVRVLSEPGDEVAVILTGVEGEIKSALLHSDRL
ncbi:MAG: homoserine dehydrogenase, partial [Clostridia bacterium]|nr:homoserine dehydrogenase [Clostridia bacterium]